MAPIGHPNPETSNDLNRLFATGSVMNLPRSTMLRKGDIIFTWLTRVHGVSSEDTFPVSNCARCRYQEMVLAAHRVLIIRELKGLQDVISYTAMHWHQDDKGWRFATEAERDDSLHMTPDPYDETLTHLQDLYYREAPGYKGRFTTPTLYDTKSKTIVNNESANILRMLSRAFDSLLPEDKQEIDLYPQGYRCDIDRANDWIYTDLNNGVYRAGFATKQDAYEKAAIAVFQCLDRIEAYFDGYNREDRPYFFGPVLTETDIRIFTTVVRFDPVYVQHFKVNMRDIRNGYPGIHRWLRNLYWNHEAFKKTTNFEHIKKNYTQSQLHVNPTGISPIGPVPDIMPLD